MQTKLLLAVKTVAVITMTVVLTDTSDIACNLYCDHLHQLQLSCTKSKIKHRCDRAFSVPAPGMQLAADGLITRALGHFLREIFEGCFIPYC